MADNKWRVEAHKLTLILKNRSIWVLPTPLKGEFTMALSKAQIVGSINKETGIAKPQATKLIEILLKTVKNSLESGDDVLISGFGKFCIKEKQRRRGRNPATGESMTLEPRRVVTFKCSGKLRDRINN